MSPPQLAVAALLVREEDGRVLLAHHARGPLAGMWALPTRAVGRAEVAEQALAHLLHDQLHLGLGSADFAETLAVERPDGAAVVLNIFLGLGWSGTPRFAAADYHDVQWDDPAAPAVTLPGAIGEWLAGAAGAARAGGSVLPDAAALAAELTAAREAFDAAYAAFAPLPPEARLRWDLDGGWAAVDLLAHAATVEAYYREETRRLLEGSGHTWRPFNDAQAEAERRTRPRPDEETERRRMAAVRAETLDWLRARTVEELATYGNHEVQGVVRVGQQIRRIARHDEAHARQLHAMRERAARRPAPEEPTDAAADR